MTTIAFFSLKGGVGKSTLCFLCARYLSCIGYHVLCLDFDRQNTLTTYCVDSKQTIQNHNIVQAFLDDDLSKHTLLIDTNFSFVPCVFDLNKISHIRTHALQELLQKVPGHYSFCLIDCAPHVDLFSLNSVYASECIVSPINFNQPDCISAMTLKKIITLETGQAYKLRFLLNKTPPLKSDNPKTITNQYKSLFQETLAESLLKTTIPEIRNMSKIMDTGSKINPEKNLAKFFMGFTSLIREVFHVFETPKEF